MDWPTLLVQGKIVLGENSFDICHLRPYKFSLIIPATGSYSEIKTDVIVNFSSHCISNGPKDQPFDFSIIGENHKIIDHRNIERKFSYERYAFSKDIRKIIEQMVNKKCYQSGYRNYFIVELNNQSDLKKNYHIFFVPRRHGNSLEITIESAYPKEEFQPSRYRSIRGSVLFAKIFRREKIRL